jgi:acyl dehydratase
MSQDVSKWIGFDFPSFTFTVERGKIREFAMAIGDDNQIYVNQNAAVEAGFADVTIPPTFPTVIDFWGGADFFEMVQSLELNPLKVLHGEQEFEYHGEVYPGDELSVTCKVVDAKSKSRMNLITLESVYTNQRGETVLIGRSTVIEMH